MLVALLLGLTLAMPESGETTMTQVDVSAGFGYRLTQQTNGSQVLSVDGSSGREVSGFASAGFTLYGKSLVDDDAPPSLQAYLQYATRLHIGGGGGYSDRQLPDDDGSSPLAHGWVEAEAEGYYQRRLYLAASFEYDYDTWRFDGDSMSEQLQTFAAAIGLRFGDLRVSAGWGGTAYGIGAGRSHVRFYGGAFLDLYSVIDRSFELDVGARAAEGGAEGHVAATWWLGRRLGLTLGGSGGAHAFVDSPMRYEFVSGSASALLWFTPKLAGQLAFAVTWLRPLTGADDTAVGGIANVLTLTLLVR